MTISNKQWLMWGNVSQSQCRSPEVLAVFLLSRDQGHWHTHSESIRISIPQVRPLSPQRIYLRVDKLKLRILISLLNVVQIKVLQWKFQVSSDGFVKPTRILTLGDRWPMMGTQWGGHRRDTISDPEWSARRGQFLRRYFPHHVSINTFGPNFCIVLLQWGLNKNIFQRSRN